MGTASSKGAGLAMRHDEYHEARPRLGPGDRFSLDTGADYIGG